MAPKLLNANAMRIITNDGTRPREAFDIVSHLIRSIARRLSPTLSIASPRRIAAP
jgi:hypothetical protein